MASWFSKSPADTEYVAESTGDTAQLETEEATLPPSEIITECIVGEIAENAEPPSTRLAVVDGPTRSIALLSQAKNAIAEARTLDELKSIRDKAEAVRKYAEAAGLGLEIQNQAAEMKLRAERRAGSMLSKLKLHGGDRREETATDRVTLEEIGISKDQSSRWQLAASVPEKAFERFLEEAQQEHGEVTTAGLTKLARDLSAKKKKKNTSTEVAPAVEDCQMVPTISELIYRQKYACVYVDAPWPFSGEPSEHDDKALEAFCITLSQQPIQELVEEHCHLHMWATDESLFAAKAVMEAWGFAFKGALICLNNLGRPGNYWVEAHEYLLLGVRGGLPLMERGMNSWMRACREPDGNSPDNIRRLIERVSPGPYLHLFGHKPISGWTVYSSMAGRDFSTNPVCEEEEADDAEAASS